MKIAKPKLIAPNERDLIPIPILNRPAGIRVIAGPQIKYITATAAAVPIAVKAGPHFSFLKIRSIANIPSHAPKKIHPEFTAAAHFGTLEYASAATIPHGAAR